MHNPLQTHHANVNGTANLLEAARINAVKRFIFSSSSAVYGQQLGSCTETAHCKPASPYGLSKLIGEMMCKQYTQNFNVETVSLRYFNVYGPRQDPFAPYASAMAHFRAAMAANKPITVYGDGLQTRRPDRPCHKFFTAKSRHRHRRCLVRRDRLRQLQAQQAGGMGPHLLRRPQAADQSAGDRGAGDLRGQRPGAVPP